MPTHARQFDVDRATMHIERAQHHYANSYNLRARDKHSQEGDLVVVLAADNAGKLYPLWIGPVAVVKL